MKSHQLSCDSHSNLRLQVSQSPLDWGRQNSLTFSTMASTTSLKHIQHKTCGHSFSCSSTMLCITRTKRQNLKGSFSISMSCCMLNSCSFQGRFWGKKQGTDHVFIPEGTHARGPLNYPEPEQTTKRIPTMTRVRFGFTKWRTRPSNVTWLTSTPSLFDLDIQNCATLSNTDCLSCGTL